MPASTIARPIKISDGRIDDVDEEYLDSLIDHEVKVFLASGKALDGKLKKYTGAALYITGEKPGSKDTMILWRQVSTVVPV
jgi:hypothetical protein